MNHPLQHQVRTVATRARALRLVHGVCRVFVLVVTAVFFVCLLDFLIHFQDRGVRLLGLSAVVLLIAWAVHRYVYSVWRYRMNGAEIARKIECRFPQLSDRLSSAMEFLQQSEEDPTAGSAALRRAVVTETTHQLERLRLSGVLDMRPSLRMAMAAAVAGIVVAAVYLFDPESSSLAVRRLVSPWGQETWNHLEFTQQPARIAAGEDFDVELVDRRGRLPRSVEILYWFQGTPEKQVRIERMERIDNKMVHRLPNVRRPFRYRAEGGDDHAMHWIEVDVLEPPRVAALDIQLHPPPYTGWAMDVPDGPHLVALEGTRVALQGMATQPITSARLHVGENTETRQLAAQVSDQELGFRLTRDSTKPWVIAKSGVYWFELTGIHRLIGGKEERWEVRSVAHRAPAVSLDRPQSQVFATPDALLNLIGSVSDQLAIHWIDLSYVRSDRSDQGENTIELFRGPPTMPPSEIRGVKDMSEQGDVRSVDHMWDLSTLEDLAPGTQLVFHLSASNYKPLENQSRSRRLTIITPDQLQERFAQRRTLLLGQLQEILDRQRESRSKTTSLEIQLKEAGAFSKSDVDQLQSADLIQRDVTRRLLGESNGVHTQLAALLDALDLNRVDSPDMERRLTTLMAEIEQIGGDLLPVIEHKLVAALKIAQSELRPTIPPRDKPDSANASRTPLQVALDEAGGHQDQVIIALEQMLSDLSKWDHYRRFERRVSQLRRNQQEVKQRTDELRKTMLTRSPDEKHPHQDRADFQKIAQSQLELARRLDKIQGRMEQMKGDVEEDDPLVAQTLADALEASARLGISSQMRQSGRHVERNQLGQAATVQKNVSRHLDEMLDVLTNRREHELERLVRKLREAERELLQLDDQQKGLSRKMDRTNVTDDPQSARADLERTGRRMQQVQEPMERLARRLRRLQADQAASSTRRGASHLRDSAQSAEQGRGGQARDRARLADKEIEKAKQELQETRRAAEGKLLEQQLARLDQDLAGLHQQQQPLRDLTTEYDDLRREQGDWNRAQAAGLRDLAHQQQGLSDETRALAEKFRKARVFYLGLRSVMIQMGRAADELQVRETGKVAQGAQQNSMDRLDQLLEALRSDDDDQAKSDNESGGAGQGGDPGGAQTALTNLAELKLLKIMQQTIRDRTAVLEQARLSDGTLQPDDERELIQLTREQGELARLMFDLFQPPQAALEDDPESLPDVREQPLK